MSDLEFNGITATVRFAPKVAPSWEQFEEIWESIVKPLGYTPDNKPVNYDDEEGRVVNSMDHTLMGDHGDYHYRINIGHQLVTILSID